MDLSFEILNNEWNLTLKVKMSEQLIFNFPFKKKLFKSRFLCFKNNFNAFKLIESWPKWPGRFVNIFGPKGCGKTHLINILMSKIQCF